MSVAAATGGSATGGSATGGSAGGRAGGDRAGGGTAMPPYDRAARWRCRVWWGALALIVVVGFAARVWNIDFDQRQHMHPDERHWSMTADALGSDQPARHSTLIGPLLDWLDGDRSPANPYRVTNSFVYGPSTLAAGRALAGWLHAGAADGAQPAAFVVSALDSVGIPLLDDAGAPRFNDRYDVDLVGRLLGAVLDSLTIVVVALAGRRLAGRALSGEQPGGEQADAGGLDARWVGLAAAAVHAASVLAIQHAHYFGSEPALALAAAVTLWAVLAADRSADRRSAIRGGAFVGAAAGATVAVKLSGIGVPLVALGGLAVLVLRHRRVADVIRLGSALVAMALAVRVLLPGAFVGLGWRPRPQFLDDMRSASAGAFSDFPPAIQWAGRVPVLEVGGWLLRSTIGPGTAVAAGIGALALVRRRRAIGRYPVAMVLGTIVVSALMVVRGPITSGRYFVPLLPALAVAAGYGVVALWSQRHVAVAWRRHVGTATSMLIAGTVVLWPLAFVAGVHGHEYTRIAAARWVAEHVPAGASLSHQAWDDGLPLGLVGVDPAAYPSVELHVWEPDSVDKLARLAGQLAEVDYVVETSPRVWNSVVRIPERFPSTIELFDALDDGRLGFERVATFASPPRLGPFRLDSNAVEEAFSVYDHPEVRIWQRVHDIGAAAIFTALDPQAADNAVHLTPAQAATHGARLTADERAENALAPSFDDSFATSRVFGAPVVQLLGWAVLIALIAIATWIVAAPVLGRLPDAGAGVAATLGLVGIVAATVLLAGGAGLVLSRGLVAAIITALLVAAAVAVWRRPAMLREHWLAKRRAIVTAVVVSVAGGALALLLRVLNPDLWNRYTGGEKPFELAMLTSVLRARTLPPPDLWFSGGALNYYYGGSLLVATPARVLRTAPGLTFNLGIGLVGALVAGAAYSAGAGVWSLHTVLVRDFVQKRTKSLTRTRVDDRGARRAGALAAAFVLLVPNVATVVAVARHAFRRAGSSFDWWAPSRVVAGQPLVTEFPAWTVVFADLHAHLLGLPVMLTLAAVLCAGVLLVGDRHRPAVAVMGAAGGLIGLLVGAIRTVNTWDAPVAAVLVLVTAGVVVALVARQRGRWVGVAVAAVCALAALVVPWWPFTRRLIVADFGLLPVADPTPLLRLLAQFGLWSAVSAVAITLVAVDLVPRSADRAVWRAAHGPSRWWASIAGAALVVLGVAGLVAIAASIGRLALAAAIGLALGCTGGAVAIVRRHRRDGAAVSDGATTATGGLVCLALGWAAIAVIEVVSLDEGVARVNTVFKGWFQAWWLLAVGSAVVVTVLLSGRRVRIVGCSIVALATVMAAAFAGVLVPARLHARDGVSGAGFDGMSFLRAGLTIEDNGVGFDPGDDRLLLDWLRANVTGFPTVVEAPGNGYRWTARVGSYAGLPTVIGWPYHQSQQRPGDGDEIARRIADVTALYTAAVDQATALRVLWRYDAAYVMFGTAERALTEDDPQLAAAVRALPCTDLVVGDGAASGAAVNDETVAGDTVAADETDGDAVSNDVTTGFVLAVDQSCVAALVLPTLTDLGQISN